MLVAFREKFRRKAVVSLEVYRFLLAGAWEVWQRSSRV